MSIKLGSTNIILPHSKAYLGSNLIYQKSSYEDIEFTSCPFPTSWYDAGTVYFGVNNYGTWICGCDSYYSSSYIPTKAFDEDNLSTYWRSANFDDDNTTYEIFIELPDKALIKPTQIYIRGQNVSSKAKVFGYNSTTGEWEELCTNTLSSGGTFNVNVDKFYSKFKLMVYRYSATLNYTRIYSFYITSGTLRKEN